MRGRYRRIVPYLKLHKPLRANVDSPSTFSTTDNASIDNLFSLHGEVFQPKAVCGLGRDHVQLDGTVPRPALPNTRYVHRVPFPVDVPSEHGHEAGVGMTHQHEGLAAFADLGAEACWSDWEAFWA